MTTTTPTAEQLAEARAAIARRKAADEEAEVHAVAAAERERLDGLEHHGVGRHGVARRGTAACRTLQRWPRLSMAGRARQVAGSRRAAMTSDPLAAIDDTYRRSTAEEDEIGAYAPMSECVHAMACT